MLYLFEYKQSQKANFNNSVHYTQTCTQEGSANTTGDDVEVEEEYFEPVRHGSNMGDEHDGVAEESESQHRGLRNNQGAFVVSFLHSFLL